MLGGKIHKEALSRSTHLRQMLTASEQLLPTQSKCIDGADVHPRKVLRALCLGAARFADGVSRSRHFPGTSYSSHCSWGLNGQQCSGSFGGRYDIHDQVCDGLVIDDYFALGVELASQR